jgi:hypothetical protein
MTKAPRRLQVGSAAIVFGIASVSWFLLAWSTIEKIAQGVPNASPATNLKLAIGVTIPLVIVTGIALFVRNTTGSETQSWIAAGVAFVIAAIGFVSWLSYWATSYS